MIFTITVVVTVLGAAVQADPTCSKEDGLDTVYFPDKDCTKFWQCIDGVAHLQECPNMLHFNPKLNVCEWPNQAGCISSSTEDDSNSSESGENKYDDKYDNSDESDKNKDCPAEDGEYIIYLPDKDCNVFWQCIKGVAYKYNCPDGLHFNPKTNVCTWPYLAGCNGDNVEAGGSISNESDGDDKVIVIKNYVYQL